MRSTTANDHANPSASRLPERDELLARLSEKYGVRHGVEELDRSRLLHIVDTFDFLAQHLPSDGGVDLARVALEQHMAAK
jgi:hypothetical protein